MAKIDRLERLDMRRAEAEADYAQALIDALRRTEAGSLSLFDHGQDKKARALAAPVIASLSEMADEIDAMRGQLAMPPFVLHREFLDARGPVASSAVGERKQARAWLERLDKPA